MATVTGVRVHTALDRWVSGDLQSIRLLRGRRVALLAHAASVDQVYRHTLDVLEQIGAHVEVLLGPEHGFLGTAQYMVGVESTQPSMAPSSHVGRRAVHSLYGDSFDDLSPKAAWLEGLDAVVIDLQDVGARYYTYVWTAALTMKIAASIGVSTYVIDRPNPLGGEVIEGAPQRAGYSSFVGLYPVCVRHAMTIGELLTMVATIERLDRNALQVLTMDGWERSMEFEDTGLPWVAPSPNMPTMQTARVYPGGCLLEATRLSEGRGTTKPFEYLGAPGIDAKRVVEQVKIDGAVLRPLAFEPTYEKYARRVCSGVQVHVTNRDLFRSYDAYRLLITAMLSQLDPSERWRTEPYEFVDDIPAIDLLTGGPEFRAAVEADAYDSGNLLDREGVAEFEEVRRQFLLYE